MTVVAPYASVYKVAAYLPMTAAMCEDAAWYARILAEVAIGPLHGPPVPAALELRRRLHGRPVGRFQRAPSPT